MFLLLNSLEGVQMGGNNFILRVILIDIAMTAI